ncbi:methyltransferase domain-containing protein [Paenibacillus sp. HJL G12]|uniref:Methyltransferase domain-containing protein n=1 Tax=Paenibacillus dendrobii TaxID=2691084 RepID=A0A7X3II06_9BACL|nr:class I SAM-dependent methyltransferase [Paenibacillus dendrobii]MWV44309.1 methyltransferase domain-containing protein [Paenibacillus dendrobii]
MEKNSSLEFYNELSETYHLIFNDWYQAVQWQGDFFNGFIRLHVLPKDEGEIKLLDASCGIGTQALGLAQHGFTITATDLSPKSVERAKREAQKLGVQITFGTADFRTLDADVPGKFKVVLSADNAIPHLLTDADLEKACRNFYDKLEDNGLLIISIRDYDREILDKQRATIPRVMDGGKRIVFQVWDWVEGSSLYMINHFIMQEQDGIWQTEVNKTAYRALLREELSEALRRAGFQDIQWHMPAESGYYQPMVTART